MPVYQLGNGDEYFDSASVPDWTNDSSVIGGNGNDTIIARGSYPFSANHILVAGGNGNYNITLDASNSVAIGGNGNNTLTSIGGLGNTLEGGNGDNLLISDGGGSGMGPGNTLTGGTGNNTFQLSNDGNLIVTKGADAADVVTNGDVFVGPMDVITNYKPGDHIGLRSYGAPANEPAPTLVQDVPLAPDPLSNTGSNFRPVVGGDDYAAFRGTFAGINSFTVNSSGPDLFVVYDTRTGPNELVGKGSLVLLGVDGQTATGRGALRRNRTWGRLERPQPGQQRPVFRPERRRPEQPGSSRRSGQADEHPFRHGSHSHLAKPRRAAPVQTRPPA